MRFKSFIMDKVEELSTKLLTCCSKVDGLVLSEFVKMSHKNRTAMILRLLYTVRMCDHT